MAWGRIYRENGNWYTDIRHHGQRHRKMIGKNRKVAERILQKLLGDLALEEHGILDNAKITLKDFASDFLTHKAQGMRPRSYHRIRGIIIGHLVPILGRYYLFDLTMDKVVAYQTRRLKYVSNATVNREVGTLRNMLNVAVQWKRLRANPIRDLPKLKEPPGRLRFLSLKEIHTLLACCPPLPNRLKDMVMVALTTGMRRGEILGLRWDYIRLDNRLIILPITKNNTVRVIPINDTLHRILSEMPEKTGYVFGNGNGGHVGDIKHSFTSACRKAGITDFRFHDLRHTYASHLAMRGVHIRALQELLGHKTLAMTQRYSHLAPEQLQNAVKLLDGVIEEN
jgi:integrase